VAGPGSAAAPDGDRDPRQVEQQRGRGGLHGEDEREVGEPALGGHLSQQPRAAVQGLGLPKQEAVAVGVGEEPDAVAPRHRRFQRGARELPRPGKALRRKEPAGRGRGRVPEPVGRPDQGPGRDQRGRRGEDGRSSRERATPRRHRERDPHQREEEERRVLGRVRQEVRLDQAERQRRGRRQRAVQRPGPTVEEQAERHPQQGHAAPGVQPPVHVPRRGRAVDVPMTGRPLRVAEPGGDGDRVRGGGVEAPRCRDPEGEGRPCPRQRRVLRVVAVVARGGLQRRLGT